MPLDFQSIDVPFGKLDTHTDPADLPPGDLTVAGNLSSQQDGVYRKRFGYAQLAAGPNGLARLASFGSELLAVSQTNLQSYNAALTTWNDRGAIPNAQTSQQVVFLDQADDVIRSTRCTVGNVTVHAWIAKTPGSVFVQVRSAIDGAIISQSTTADTLGVYSVIHSAAVGQYVIVFYSSATSQLLRYQRIDTTTGTIVGPTTFSTDVWNTRASFDICAINSTDVDIAWVSVVPNIKVARFNVSTQTTSAGPTAVSGETPDTGIATVATAGEGGYIAYFNAANVRVACYDAGTTAQTVAPTTVTAIPGALNGINIALARFDSTHALLCYDRLNAAPDKNSSHFLIVSNAAGLTSSSALKNANIASKPFVYAGNYYVNLWANYTAQYTYFTARIIVSGVAYTALPVAMHAYRAAYPSAIVAGQVTEVDQPSTGVFAFNGSLAYKFLSSGTPRAGLASFLCDFASVTRFLPLEANGETYFASGVVDHYDGFRACEANFLLYPEIRSATPGAVGASGMDNGTYSYIVVFEAGTQTGNVDRSTTALPLSATTSAGAGLGKVTLVVDHLTITTVGWSGQRQGIASIFRTKASGTTYFFIGSVTMDPTTANFTYVDQAHDSTIGSNRNVYTTGGVLDREPPLAAMQLVLHRNRIWGISSADRRLAFYSGELVPGEAAWFSSAQQLRFDVGADLIGLVSMDEKLIGGKIDSLFFVPGEPPNQLGQGSTLQLPQRITADCGFSDPRALVLVPKGVLFRSTKGMQILTRSLETVFLKEPDGYLDPSNQAYNTFTATAAASILTSIQEARFDVYSSSVSSLKLVYNYRDDRWTVHTNTGSGSPVSAAIVGGVYYWGNATGTVYKEDSTTYLDPSSTYVGSTLSTGWIRPAGKQGLVRVQKVLVLNDWRTGHDLTFQIRKDYITLTTDSAAFSAAQILALGLVEQLTKHLTQQVGESFQFVMFDQAPTSGSLGTGEGFAARGIALYTGLKRGSFDKTLQAGARV